jgi:hypothetical protein
MWVSQTYITNLKADGAVSAYFLFESYRDDHMKLQARLQDRLGALARRFGDDAHVFVPTTADRGSIEKEFNEWLHTRSRQRGDLGIELPGLLVVQHPLGDGRSLSGDAAFISFAELLEPTVLENPLVFSLTSDRLLAQVSEALQELKAEVAKEADGLDKALANLQLRPGLWGVGYDLKPHLVSVLRRFRRNRPERT